MAGKVRVLGASNYSAERLEAALALSAANGLARFACLQPLYNLLDREPFESSLAPACERHGLGVASYYSLASGFLSGKVRRAADAEGRARAMRLKGYCNERGWRVLEAIDAAAQREGATPAAVAIAWLLARPVVTAPIASATTTAQLDELLRGAELRLDAETLRALDAVSSP
jgi:aryl-alcohol dehydrogenase-like predicted oxidoreductase